MFIQSVQNFIVKLLQLQIKFILLNILDSIYIYIYIYMYIMELLWCGMLCLGWTHRHTVQLWVMKSTQHCGIFMEWTCYFLDGSASCYVSEATLQWYAENYVHLLDLPTQNPDHNPSGMNWTNKWGLGDAAKFHCPSEMLREEWWSIPMDVLHKLLESMPDRVVAIITARVDSTKFWRATTNRETFSVSSKLLFGL